MRLFFLLIIITSVYGLEVDIAAESAILMNADTGKVLYEKNAHAMRYPASLTKIATAIYTLETCADLNHPLTASKSALFSLSQEKKQKEHYPAYVLENDGSCSGLKSGEILSLKDLLFCLLVESGNDTANVIAEGVSGKIASFVDEVNEYLKEIGCKSTHFCNPHGLHHVDHYSTAYDLAILTKRALKDPTFRNIVITPSYPISSTNRQTAREIQQTNKLLKPGRYYYSPAIGVKTGYHSAAKNNLSAAATYEGRTLIAIVLGCDKRDQRFSEAIKLFNAAFSEKSVHRTLFSKDEVFQHILPGGKTTLKAFPSDEIGITYYPSEEPNARAFIHWDDIDLPIYPGQHVGEMRIMDGENLMVAIPLLAKERVRRDVLTWLKDLFKSKK